MKVKCIDSHPGKTTVGRIYDVMWEGPLLYQVTDDNCKSSLVFKDDFEVVDKT